VYSVVIKDNNNYSALLLELKKELSKHKVDINTLPIALKVKYEGAFIELADIDLLVNGSEVLIYAAKANVLSKGLNSGKPVPLGDDEVYEEKDENQPDLL